MNDWRIGVGDWHITVVRGVAWRGVWRSPWLSIYLPWGTAGIPPGRKHKVIRGQVGLSGVWFGNRCWYLLAVRYRRLTEQVRGAAWAKRHLPDPLD